MADRWHSKELCEVWAYLTKTLSPLTLEWVAEAIQKEIDYNFEGD